MYIQIKLGPKGPDEISLVVSEWSRLELLALLRSLPATPGGWTNVGLRGKVGKPSQERVELIGLEEGAPPHQPGDCTSLDPRKVCGMCAEFRRNQKHQPKAEETKTNGSDQTKISE